MAAKPSKQRWSQSWWTLDDPGQRAQKVVSTVQGLRYYQNERMNNALMFLRLYGGKDAVNYYQGVAMGVGSYVNSATELAHGPRFNIVQSCIDTVTAKITLSKPKITFLTSGGNFGQQQRAKKLEKFVDGVFYETKQHQLSPEVCADAEIFGDGIQYIYSDQGKIVHEKVVAAEMVIDESEGMYGKPRNIYRVKMVSKEQLMDTYTDPKLQAAIWRMKGESFTNGSNISVQSMIPVVGAWHLPSVKDGELAADGLFTLSVGDVELEACARKKDYLPFVFLKWSKRPVGFWGQGLAEQLVPLQVEMNNVSRTISDIIRIAAVPKMYVEQSSKVNVAQMDRTIGAVVYYSGTAPVFKTNEMVVGQELLSHAENIYNKAYQIAGVSQLSSGSQVPAGLKNASGKALDTYLDEQTDRFSVFADAYQAFHMEIARQDICLAREMSMAGSAYKVDLPGKKFMESIKWSDADLDDDEFIMQMWPTNFLADAPAERLEQVQGMIAAGWFNKDIGMDLMDFPDLKQAMNLANGGVEAIKCVISSMLDDGEYSPPEPFMNLALSIQMVQSAYLVAKFQDKAPAGRLALMRRWIDQAQAMVTAAMPPPPAPMGGPPQAQGAPAPVSPLLPTQAPAGQ